MLDLALKKYGGKTPLARLARRAIGLASDGFEVGDVYVYCSALFEGTVRGAPDCAGIFLNNGRRFVSGQRLIQKDLARTLELVAELGFEVCYSGEVGAGLPLRHNRSFGIRGFGELRSEDADAARRSRRPPGCSKSAAPEVARE
jgi:gamma-glutamyltranspeptidase/glutathione hydrolase